MEKALDRAADRARGDHTYQNRTGDLTLNTFAELKKDTANEAQVDLVMATDYASYLFEDGKTSFEEQADVAENELTAHFTSD